MDEPVFALFTGPALVLAAVSGNWTSRNWQEPPIGVPACEAWPDEAWAPLQAAMREAYSSGAPGAVDCGVLGVFTVVPVGSAEGVRPGVALVQRRPARTGGPARRRPAPLRVATR